MTGKRFELILYDGTIRVKEIRDNGEVIYPNEVEDLLNEFNETEERLYDYFSKWFEEERGVYHEEFNMLWASIKEGEKDD